MTSLLALVGDMHHWRFSTFICPREIMRPSGTRTDKRSIREVTLKIILANSPRLVSHLSTGGKNRASCKTINNGLLTGSLL